VGSFIFGRHYDCMNWHTNASAVSCSIGGIGHRHPPHLLLQKSLPVSVGGDSVALMRFATEAGDDGATQSRSKTALCRSLLSDFCNKIGTTPSSSFRRGTLPRVDPTYRRQQRNSNSSGSKIRHSLKSLLGIAQRSGNHSWFHLSRRSARTTNPHELRWCR
jgi:hypothetical protein